MPKKTEIDHYTDKEALDFHVQGKSGKIEITSSKPLTTKRDLSLAYSPGVAAPVKEIAKNQPNFEEVSADTKASEGDLVVLDYEATVDDKPFKGSEGKNTQLTLGKDLFLKGFDKQLIGVKKDDTKIVEALLPENFPEKNIANKKSKFTCKIISVKKPEEVKINDDFAKNLGAKDLEDLKKLISNQINDEYKNSLDRLTKNQILK